MKSIQIELDEAITAGQNLLITLNDVKHDLSSAQNWGIADIFSKSMLVTFFKQSKLSDARRTIDLARRDIDVFKKELQDLDIRLDDVINQSNSLIFMDYFLDGFFVDIWVQSKINESRRNVSDLIDEVSTTVNRLREMKHNL
ncbi:hypothetical protein G7062_00195 [Erysipelothrix sp. HDW6C]|uniref:hypothetical protein n=1 Tax=Erysipelothrix sp. HDW6C TaxID=2714930 RepID=UPI00140A7F84|nr:hypothetical protein [Erysipelothrix sp. HDW6C]QIK68794.1 hypothetical protein G7062_00195 [Erysipelothrix sp. HDW6C]